MKRKAALRHRRGARRRGSKVLEGVDDNLEMAHFDAHLSLLTEVLRYSE